MLCFYGHLTLCAFDGVFVASLSLNKIHMYGCTSAGLELRFVSMTVVPHPITVEGAKELLSYLAVITQINVNCI